MDESQTAIANKHSAYLELKHLQKDLFKMIIMTSLLVRFSAYLEKDLIKDGSWLDVNATLFYIRVSM